MRPIQKTIDIASADANGVAEAQTPVGGVDLTLDGVLVTDDVATFIYPTYVTLASATDMSAIEFTVKGTSPTVDNAGSYYLAETITGPNNATVTTTNIFATVTSIEVATGDDYTLETVVAGGATVGVGDGPWWPLDIYTPNQVTTVSCNILDAGSAAYSVEYTNEDPYDTSITQLAVAHPVAALTGASTDQTAFTATLMRAVRVNVASGDGQLRVTVVQQSTR